MLEYAEPIEIREPDYFGDEMAQELDRRAEERRRRRSRDAELEGVGGDQSSDPVIVDHCSNDGTFRFRIVRCRQ